MTPPEKPDPPAPAPVRRSGPITTGGWVALGLIVLAVILLWLSEGPKAISYSGFKSLAQSGQLKKVTLYGKERLTGEVRDKNAGDVRALGIPDGKFSVVLPPTENVLAFARDLETWNDEYWARVQRETRADPPERLVITADEAVLQATGPVIWAVVLLAAIAGVFVFVVLPRVREPGGGGFLNSYVRSPARRYDKGRHRVVFDDVAGMDAAKRELQEIVDFLRNPEKFTRLGAQVPKGVLLVGPPGTGKTMLAKAVAGEANVPFCSINGAEVIQMFVGVGASRVRDLFKTAKENAPCVIFIDEIDAVGRMRGAGVGGGSDEREQTLNQILGEMDGFQPTETVIVIAATNRPDVLDSALLRPGRFDRHVTVDRPTWQGRLAILKVHTRNKPLDDDVDLEQVARKMTGMTGADLRNLANEAALLATREGKVKIDKNDFDRASDRVLLGPTREELLTPEGKRKTAYHEAGHALVALLEPHADPPQRVTIVPRGRALGVPSSSPADELYHYGVDYWQARLASMMGGRAADRLVFDQPYSGHENDLKEATRGARYMVTHWGMSDRLGPMSFRIGEEHVFLGKEIQEPRDFSEGTAQIIDEEVQKLLREADQRAYDLLRGHRHELDKLVEALLEKEELDRSEIEELLSPETRSIVHDVPDDGPRPAVILAPTPAAG